MDRPGVLMCPPDYYEIAYEINPWMRTTRRADVKESLRQWQGLYDTLHSRLRAKVELMTPVKGLPDMVFTANAGLVLKRLFIRSNFRYKERKGEEVHFAKWFRKKGYIVKTIERPYSFEGEGDALFMGKELYTGYHFRSDIESHDLVSGMLKRPYFGLQLCDKRFYHLDTCFAPLNEKSALVHLPAFEAYAQMTLLESIPDPIRVPQKEAECFACNAVVIGENVIIPEDCPVTTRELEKRGFTGYALPFTEFIKAGGAGKCLVLKI